MADSDWLRACVVENLQQLVALHFEGAPPAETIVMTAQAWLRVMIGWPIAWEEKLDRPRLDSAFLALAGQAQRWPSPGQLRALLPARTYPDPELDAPQYPADKAAANRKKIKTLLAAAFELRDLQSKLTQLQHGPMNTEKSAQIDALKNDIARLQQQINEAAQP
ncbi:hypothetical protein [Methylobacter sp.]|uniref:hypothetical protein n=1 Tax=Methylobacter sp. TaxID=2051955 RepID=UPI002FDEB503